MAHQNGLVDPGHNRRESQWHLDAGQGLPTGGTKGPRRFDRVFGHFAQASAVSRIMGGRPKTIEARIPGGLPVPKKAIMGIK